MRHAKHFSPQFVDRLNHPFEGFPKLLLELERAVKGKKNEEVRSILVKIYKNITEATCPNHALNREAFRLFGGPVLVRRIVAMDPKTHDGFPDPKKVWLIRAEAIQILREMCYVDHAAALELSCDPDIFGDLVALLSHRSTCDNASALMEELLALKFQRKLLDLTQFPDLVGIISGLNSRQLSFFCRVLAMCVYVPPEDLQGQVILDKKIPDFADNTDRNQSLLLSVPDLLPRLVHVVTMYDPSAGEWADQLAQNHAVDLINILVNISDEGNHWENLQKPIPLPSHSSSFAPLGGFPFHELAGSPFRPAAALTYQPLPTAAGDRDSTCDPMGVLDESEQLEVDSPLQTPAQRLAASRPSTVPFRPPPSGPPQARTRNNGSSSSAGGGGSDDGRQNNNGLNLQTFGLLAILGSGLMGTEGFGELMSADVMSEMGLPPSTGGPASFVSARNAMRSLSIAPHMSEVLFVLCTLTSGRRKTQVQDQLASLRIAPVLQKMFESMSWDPRDFVTHEHTPLHGPGCECSPETSVRIQFLRLVHAFCDRDLEGQSLRTLLLTPQELAAAGLEMLYPKELYCSGDEGLVTAIIRALMDQPDDSLFKVWLATCVESFIRGSNPWFQCFAASTGIIKCLFEEIVNDRCQKPGSLQTNFDLIGEICKYNPATTALLEQCLDDATQREKFFRLVSDNLVDSNVFLRSVLITVNSFRTRPDVYLAATQTHMWRWIDSNRLRLIRDLMTVISVGDITQENICCLNSALSFFLFADMRGELLALLEEVRSFEEAEHRHAELNALHNFHDLLQFWKRYYSLRGRDCLSLEYAARIPFGTWKSVVDKLGSQDVNSPFCLKRLSTKAQQASSPLRMALEKFSI